jgi:hypothetical protein
MHYEVRKSRRTQHNKTHKFGAVALSTEGEQEDLGNAPKLKAARYNRLA